MRRIPYEHASESQRWLIALHSRLVEEFSTSNCLALAYNVFASYQDWAHQNGLYRRWGVAHGRQVFHSGDLPPKRIINQRILGAEHPRAEEWDMYYRYVGPQQQPRPKGKAAAPASAGGAAGTEKEQNPLFIELCSGRGILSATVSAQGFDLMPVDHKHRVHIKTFNLDLTDPHSWTILRYIVDQCNVIGVHLAPPCGTCSRAREIKISDAWHGPQPLRNREYPYGVPNMSAKDWTRVEQANSLYIHMSAFCSFLNDRGIAWTMENPTDSWLWELPCMEELMGQMFFFHFLSFMCIWR